MIVYGVNPVLEALKAGRAARVTLATKGLPRPTGPGPADLSQLLPRLPPRLAEVVTAARQRGVPVDLADSAAIEARARGAVHQGVMAELRHDDAGGAWTPESLVAAAPGVPLIVVLDGIEDPQNVGALLRSAEAAGADGVIRQTRHSAPLAGAVARASAGAVHHLRIASVVNIARAIEALKASGVWVVGLAGEAGDSYDALDYTVPTAFVLGAEGTGLRRLVRQRCDRLVRIPMHGRVSSLNVSVAAGIVLYEAVRQRRERAEARGPERSPVSLAASTVDGE